MVKYAEDFIKEVERLYNRYEHANLYHFILTGDNSAVGEFLANEQEENLAPEYVLFMIDAGKIEKLRQEAERRAGRFHLLIRWIREYSNNT